MVSIKNMYIKPRCISNKDKYKLLEIQNEYITIKFIRYVKWKNELNTLNRTPNEFISHCKDKTE